MFLTKIVRVPINKVMAMQKTNAFAELRASIRKASQQFRNNDDNSESIFHPLGGFISGYNLAEVDAALDIYEAQLPSEFQESRQVILREDEIIQLGSQICAEHQSEEVRYFAQSVVAYFIAKGLAANSNPFHLVRSSNRIEPEVDE
jgi:hypothetical protein